MSLCSRFISYWQPYSLLVIDRVTGCNLFHASFTSRSIPTRQTDSGCQTEMHPTAILSWSLAIFTCPHHHHHSSAPIITLSCRSIAIFRNAITSLFAWQLPGTMIRSCMNKRLARGHVNVIPRETPGDCWPLPGTRMIRCSRGYLASLLSLPP